MARRYFLAKTEPGAYSIDALEKESRTIWSGVRNPQAVAALKEMKNGDRVFIYHSGGESAFVGLAGVVGKGRPDPKDAKSHLVDFKFLWRFREPYLTLAEVKGSGRFPSLPLVKQGRLSVMALPDSFVDWLGARGLRT